MKTNILFRMIGIYVVSGNILLAQEAPQLIQPQNNAIYQDICPVFQWTPVEGAVEYEVWIANTQISNQGVIINTPTTAVQPSPGHLLNNSQYKWWVIPFFVMGGSERGPASETWYFTTGWPEANPLSPTNGAESIPSKVTFTWEECPNSTSYCLGVATDPYFENLVVDQGYITDTTYTITLQKNTQYYWQLLSMGINGSIGFSDVWTFQTGSTTPVELASFMVRYQNNTVELSWTTLSETNNLGFYIEKKVSSEDYVGIGFVQGHGTIQNPIEYKFIDYNSSNKAFYRLRQMDTDGTFYYSQAVQAEQSGKQLDELCVYPNPFNNSAAISFYVSSAGPVTMKIYDIQGREITTLLNKHMQDGKHTIQWQNNITEQLTSGVYIISLQTLQFHKTKRIIYLK